MNNEMQAEVLSASVASADDVLRCAMDVAQATLKSGGSIARVEETVMAPCTWRCLRSFP